MRGGAFGPLHITAQIIASRVKLRDQIVAIIDKRPFTHILKPAGTAGFEMLPIVEWLCLELRRVAGFAVPDIGLMAMPDGMTPALELQRLKHRGSV